MIGSNQHGATTLIAVPEELKDRLETLAGQRGETIEQLIADAVDGFTNGGASMSEQEADIALKFVLWLRGAGMNPDVRHFAVMMLKMIGSE